MAEIFNHVLTRMAAGETKKLFADPAISLDHPLSYNGLSGTVGSFSIYSRNDIDVVGNVRSLHPAIRLKTESFAGNSTIAYEIMPGSIGSREDTQTDGILVTYNGGEQIIPLKITKAGISSGFYDKGKSTTEYKAAPAKEAKDFSVKNQERRLLQELAKKHIEYRVAILRGSAPEKLASMLQEKMALILKLSRINPDCVRYRLYEALCFVMMGEERKASAREGLLRGEVTSSRQKHAADYCLLLLLQFLIARKENRPSEADVRKRQLISYINHALTEEAKDPDLPLILWSEELGLVDDDPMAVWNAFRDLYEDGNNSPFLFFYGGTLLMDVEAIRTVLDGGMDRFCARCVNSLVKNRACDNEFARYLSMLRPDETKPYHWHIYKKLYRMYPSRELLSNLCMVMIRCEVTGEDAFPFYREAIEQGININRLPEYYVMSLPSDYDRPVNENVMKYFAGEEIIRAKLLVKLCLNALRFYPNDGAVYSAFESRMKELVLSEIEKDHVDMDLALLADEVLVPEDLGSSLSKKLLPLIFLVRLRADVPDGTCVVYNSAIYKRPGKGVFYNKKCSMQIPSDSDGTYTLTGPSGSPVKQVLVTSEPVIRNEQLLQRIRYLCADSPVFAIEEAYSMVHDHEQGRLEPSYLLNLLDNEELSDSFRVRILNYLTEQAYRFSDQIPVTRLIPYAGHMNALEMAGFTELLIRKRNTAQAALFLPLISPDLISTSLLQDYVRNAIFETGDADPYVFKLIIYLLSRDMASSEMLSWYCEHAQTSRADMVTVYETCKLHGIPETGLKERLLLRLTLLQDADLSLLQDVLVSLSGMSDPLVSAAALNRICYGYVTQACGISEEVVSLIHGDIIHSGSIDSLSDTIKFACMKHEYEAETKNAVVTMLVEDMAQSVSERGIYLDFISGLLSSMKITAIPVITANLSANGHFGTEVAISSETERNLYGEYMIEGSDSIYRVRMKQMYDCLYSGEIVRFYHESISYRFVYGDLVTKWYPLGRWEGPGLNAAASFELAGNYEMLSGLSKKLSEGISVSEDLKNIWVLRKILKQYGRKY